MKIRDRQEIFMPSENINYLEWKLFLHKSISLNQYIYIFVWDRKKFRAWSALCRNLLLCGEVSGTDTYTPSVKNLFGDSNIGCWKSPGDSWEPYHNPLLWGMICVSLVGGAAQWQSMGWATPHLLKPSHPGPWDLTQKARMDDVFIHLKSEQKWVFPLAW